MQGMKLFIVQVSASYSPWLSPFGTSRYSSQHAMLVRSLKEVSSPKTLSKNPGFTRNITPPYAFSMKPFYYHHHRRRRRHHHVFYLRRLEDE
jgi:hypothetical protein